MILTHSSTPLSLYRSNIKQSCLADCPVSTPNLVQPGPLRSEKKCADRGINWGGRRKQRTEVYSWVQLIRNQQHVM